MSHVHNANAVLCDCAIQEALKSMNIDLSEEQIGNYIEEIDENKDGEVDFEEFQVMVKKEWFTALWDKQMTEGLQRALSRSQYVVDEEQSASDDGGDDNPIPPSHSQFDEEQIGSLKDRLAEREEEIADLKRRIAEMAIDEKEDDSLHNLQMERDSARERALKMEKRVNQLKNDNERSQTHIQGLNSENMRLKQQVGSLRKEVEESKGSRDAHRELIEATNIELDRAKSENMMLQSEMGRTCVNLENVQSEVGILRDQNRDLRDEIDSLQNDVCSLTDSKLEMIRTFSEQMNLLRKVIAGHSCKPDGTNHWLPFAVNIEWKQ